MCRSIVFLQFSFPIPVVSFSIKWGLTYQWLITLEAGKRLTSFFSTSPIGWHLSSESWPYRCLSGRGREKQIAQPKVELCVWIMWKGSLVRHRFAFEIWPFSVGQFPDETVRKQTIFALINKCHTGIIWEIKTLLLKRLLSTSYISSWVRQESSLSSVLHALEEFKKTENDIHVFRYSPYCWRFKPNYLPAFPVAAQCVISSTISSQQEDSQGCILYLHPLRESAPLFLSPGSLVNSCSSVCLEKDRSYFLSRLPLLLHVLSPVCGKEEPPHSQSLSRPQTHDF